MSQPSEPKRVPDLGRFQLDGWSVHQAEGTLRSTDRVVRLEPRVMDVLVYLAADPGTVISKEELLEAVWGGTFVEEGALAQAIHSLRKALGDDARQPRFIQTIPKRGYRLVAPVMPEEPVPESVLPSGSKTEPAPVAAPRAVHQAPVSPPPWRAWLFAAVTLLAVATVLGLSYSRSTRFRNEEASPLPASVGRRIVVLPFEDITKPADCCFTTGLTDEITKDLSSLPSLQVISRTTALQYGGIHKTVIDIGKELKVDYVLEGSVRWASGADGRLRVRITPQLVRAADDSAIWSGQFDREVTDIFAVQSEISRQVISQLGIVLTPEQNRALRKQPTKNLEAYQAYQRGMDLKNQPYYSPAELLKAVPMFERATDLDPSFAAAWAELSQSHCYLAFNSDRTPARVEAAKKALQHAVALDPEAQAVWLARVDYAYRCEQDYDAAFTQLQAAVQRFPNDAEVLQKLGFVLRRKGQLREAVEVLHHAYTLDPKTAMLVCELAEVHRALRNYEVADQFYAQAISLAPDESYYWEGRVFTRLAWTGDVTDARELFAKAPVPDDPELLTVAFTLDFNARDYRKALARLTPERLSKIALVDQSHLATMALLARERLGDHSGALAAAESNRIEIEERVKRFPKEPFYPAFLAVTLAELGRSDAALAWAEKAVRDTRDDAFAGPNFVEFQAMAEAILGRRHAAIQRVSALLSTPYRWAMSANNLRIDPAWDPLRGDPDLGNLLRRFSD